MSRSIGQVHSIDARFKQLTKMLKFCLCTGDAVEPVSVQAPLINLVNALGNDNGNVAF